MDWKGQCRLLQELQKQPTTSATCHGHEQGGGHRKGAKPLAGEGLSHLRLNSVFKTLEGHCRLLNPFFKTLEGHCRLLFLRPLAIFRKRSTVRAWGVFGRALVCATCSPSLSFLYCRLPLSCRFQLTTRRGYVRRVPLALDKPYTQSRHKR